MKKILSITLILAMLTGILPVYAMDTASADAVSAEVVNTTADPEYLNAIEFLRDMGILSGNITPNEPATRIALAEIAVKASGTGAQASADTPFDDVKTDDPRSGYVLAAFNNGLMNGYSDGIFEPNGFISYEQLIIVMTRMTGYDALAQINGGTTAAYMQAANKAGLTKLISAENESQITYGELAYAIRCTLDIEILDISSISPDKTVYDKNKGVTLLTSALEMKEVEGQITANYYTGLATPSNLKKNQIELGRKVYSSTKENIADYLGWNVVAFVDKNGVIKAVEKELQSGSEITITTNEIESVTSGIVQYRDENDNIRKVKYKNDAYLIYNGEAKLAWSASDLQAVNNGQIRMLDTDGDDVCDIIFADKYVDLIVNSISYTDGKVYFKAGSTPQNVDLAEDSDLKYDLRDASGNRIGINDISKNNLISVAMNSTGTVCKLVLSKDYVVGVCTAIDEKYIVIGEEEYIISKPLKSSGTVTLNSEGTFYINFLGNVAVLDTNIMYNYGYLRDISFNTLFNSEMAFEIYTLEGKFEIYELADKVKLNDDTKKVSELYGNANLYNNGTPIDQLICYNLNGEGKINRISTAVDGSGMSYEDKDKVFSLDAEFTGASGRSLSTRYIGGDWKLFAGRYRLDDNTRIFFIPQNIDDDEKFRVTGITALKHEDFYDVKIYDEDENNRVKAIVTPADGISTINKDSAFGVVKSVKKALNESGDNMDSVTVVSGGKEVILKCEEGKAVVKIEGAITNIQTDDDYITDNGEILRISLAKLDKGDVICYSADSSGILSDAEILLRANYPVEKEVGIEGNNITQYYFYNTRYASYVTVDAIIENGIRATVDIDNVEAVRVYPVSSTTNILCNRGNGVIEEIGVGDIAPRDKIFVYIVGSSIKLVVVYR